MGRQFIVVTNVIERPGTAVGENLMSNKSKTEWVPLLGEAKADQRGNAQVQWNICPVHNAPIINCDCWKSRQSPEKGNGRDNR